LLKKSISAGSRFLREGLVRSLGNYVGDHRFAFQRAALLGLLQGNQFSQNDFDLRFAKIPRCLGFEFFNTSAKADVRQRLTSAAHELT
jgi:hypothetical protein